MFVDIKKNHKKKQHMKNCKLYFLITFLIIKSVFVFGQVPQIEIPMYNDKYSNYVKQLEEGIINIDYLDFRNSFLESKQFLKKGRSYDSLKQKIFEELKNNNYNNLMLLTKAMLSIDYTSLYGHHFLQLTYKMLEDSVNWNKYQDIELGLLNSIKSSGDGKTCKSGWHVTQIEEEYFILNILNARLQQQSLIYVGKIGCDKMIVKTEEGETKTYYFEINKVLEMEMKMFEKK